MFQRKNKRVVVAISGGVDSATSAFLLQKKGYEVIGVFMRLGTDSYNEETLARKTCQSLGIKFYPVNLENIFHEKVIRYFLDGYSDGITPNPCVECNKLIKFGELLKVARNFNALLATGHYIRTEKKNGTYKLFRAKDKTKDQSYFLYNLKQADLKQLIFPLAALQKKDIKKLAAQRRLTHSPQESQDICFLNSGGLITDHNDYIKKHIELVPGDIKTLDNTTVGQHAGLPLYTIGQRRGVEIGGTGPFYVVKMDYAKNTLFVTGDHNDKKLFRDEFYIEKVNWISGIEPKLPLVSNVVIRYRHKGIKCEVDKIDQFTFQVKLEKKQRAVTKGQSAVFYNNDEVIGGGIIN
jgi:tRNA-uridine 2-sulfurtransferase